MLTPFLSRLLGILALPLALAYGVGLLHSPTLPEFDSATLERLRATPPAYVFIGNSMLFSRLSPEAMSAALGGEKVALLGAGGWASAHWFLQFKNHVVASGIRPKRVIFFFRGEEWTQPLHHTEGRYAEELKTLAHAAEPELEKHLSLSPNARWSLDANLRSLSAGAVEQLAYSFTLPRPLVTYADLKADLNVLLNYTRMRSETPVNHAPAAKSFSESVEASFLPRVVELAHRHAIPLGFVSVQPRPPKVDDATSYLEQMRGYLAQRNIPLFAESGLTLAHYGEGHHLEAGAPTWYPDWLVTKASHLFN